MGDTNVDSDAGQMTERSRLIGAAGRWSVAVRPLGSWMNRSGDAHAAGGLVEEALDHAEHANTELRELVYGILPNVLPAAGSYAPCADDLARRIRVARALKQPPHGCALLAR